MITCEYCGDPLTLEELPTHKDNCINWARKEENPLEDEAGVKKFVKLSHGWINVSHIIRFGVEIDEENGEKFYLVLTNERLGINEIDYVILMKGCVGGV